jgi:putative peptidoglycan lipid II flippase
MLRKTLNFAVGTFGSRIFGLLRESVTAGIFGATRSFDAFLIAFRLPNLLRELLAEGALGSSFTKVFSELWETDRKRAIALLHDSLWCFTLLAAVLVLLGIISAPLLVDGLTLFQEGQERTIFQHQCVSLTRLMFPFIGFMILGSIVSGVLHQSGKFFYSAISPILLNVGFLLGALVFAAWVDRFAPEWVEQIFVDKRITGLALGALLGGILQLGVQAAGVWRRYLGPYWQLPRKLPWSSDLGRVLRLMGPMVIAGSAGQVNVLVNTNFATSLQAGAVTWLTYSFRVLQLPIGLFAVGIGTVALPSLTRAAVQRARTQDSSLLAGELARSVEWMCWLMLPCMCFFLVNSPAIVQLLYQHGAFNETAAVATGQALYFYSFGLLGYGLIKVLTSYYYAVGQTRYPMMVGLVSIGMNFVLNLLLVSKFGHNGLAITASLVLLCNALFLLLGIRGINIAEHYKKLQWSWLMLVVAVIASYWGQQWLGLHMPRFVVEGSWGYKIDAMWALTCNGVLVVAIFAPLGFYRYSIPSNISVPRK